jgi:hypothetical protein
MKEVHIYKLLDPRDNSIKYIGKTNAELKQRLCSHISEAKRSGRKHKRAAWIKSLLNLGMKPTIELIETCENNTKASEREIYYIDLYKNEDLKNMQPGGDGQPPGYQFKKRFVGPKGVTREHFKGLPHPSTRSDWREIVKKQQLNRKPNKESPKLRKPVIAFDIIEQKEYHFESVKEASEFTKVRNGDICSRCKGKSKVPYKERWNFSYKKNGVNKLVTKRYVEITRYNDKEERNFKSILEASRECDIKRDYIYDCLKTGKPDKQGFYWRKQ